MSERIEKAKELLERYGNDTARMLDENPELETLELFSDRRESLLDWYPFRAGAKLLLAGAGTAAFWHFYSERDSRSRRSIRICRRLPFCGREKKA